MRACRTIYYKLIGGFFVVVGPGSAQKNQRRDVDESARRTEPREYTMFEKKRREITSLRRGVITLTGARRVVRKQSKLSADTKTLLIFINFFPTQWGRGRRRWKRIQSAARDCSRSRFLNYRRVDGEQKDVSQCAAPIEIQIEGIVIALKIIRKPTCFEQNRR